MNNNITAAKKLRFAPSPTGHLHIGGVRTALFNYLYAKNQGGSLVLRIEDTDVSRSSQHMAEEIIDGMRWLGINWQEGPFYQSQRFDLYKKTALSLLEQKKAYRCFCTTEQIDARRSASMSGGKSQHIYKYDRHCFHLTQEQINEKIREQIPFVIRFYIPEGITYFKDRLHKEMKVNNAELEDFAVLKSDDSPTYHLSVVVDDHDMGITDVIRGDDHLSNTFKQVLLFKALEIKPPKYAHLPLILGPDKKKLSKRHGETSVLEFKRAGYLPEAVINYLAQLSWLPADTKKIFTVDQLAKQFNLSKVAKSSPVFDYEKLKFINGRAIQQKDNSQLLDLLRDDPGFEEKYRAYAKEKQTALIGLVKPRIKTLGEFKEKFRFYLDSRDEPGYDNEELEKLAANYSADTAAKHLRLFLRQLKTIDANQFTPGIVEKELRRCAETNGLKAADLIHPCRFALTFETVSPSLFHVFEFMGKVESVRRIERCAAFMENRG